MFREHHVTATYSDSFKKYLSHTNEKSVLFEEIKRRLEFAKPKTVLDIGAGNGDMAIPLSQGNYEYIALERKPDYVTKLKNAGLKVIDAYFPTDIDKKFDFILSSHSLPWKKENYDPFVLSAINLLNAGGIFLIITYDDESGDWKKLVDECGLPVSVKKESRLKALDKWLPSLGRSYNKTIVKTYVRADTLNDILEALAFVYSDGKEEKIATFLNSDRVKEYLERKYKSSEGYSFPFSHIFLEIVK